VIAARQPLGISLLLVALGPVVWAQGSHASILGQVTDPSQSGIPRAVVSVLRIDTNERQETSADDSGNFSFAFLAPGIYTVRASAAGFKTLERFGLRLATDETLSMPLTLALGQVSDRVTVAASRETLDMSSASNAMRLDPAKLSDVPLVGRQAYSLVALTPGVIFTQEQFGTTGFAGQRGWDTNDKFIINGGLVGTNQFLLNGAPVSLTGSWQFSPNIDAIEEFKVLTNSYDAEYGRTGGGTVITTLRSGGNDWHGGVFEYFHNAIFDANTTQNNQAGLPRGKHNTHQYGGTISGPLRHDKDFLFISYEGFREIDPFPVVSDTPPLNLRDGNAFSRYGIKIFDPLTAHECIEGVDTPPGTKCAGTYIRDPFPNNTIPLTRISPIGRAILALYPSPNAPGLTQNYIAGGNVGRYRQDQPMGRWDHLFSDRDRLSAIVTFESGRDFTSTNGFDPPAEVGNTADYRTDQNYIAEYTHTLSPTKVFNFRVSFGRFTQLFPDASGNSNLTATALGMINMTHAPTVESDAPPSFDLSTYSSIIGNTYSWSTQNQWSLQPNMIQTHGKHVIHYGFEWAYAAIATAGPGRANGQFSFTPGWSQQYVNHSAGSRDGSGVADLLLGLPDTGFVDYNDSSYKSWPYFAGYIQDTWRAAKSLTLTFGLRYDVQIPFVERFNRVNSGFNFGAVSPLSDRVLQAWNADAAAYNATNPKFPYPSAPAALFGARVFANSTERRPYDTDWTDVQPRFGVAWNFAPKTVFRAGFGIFYRTATQLNQNDGFSQRTNYVSSLDSGVMPAAGLTGPYSLQNPFPNGILAPTGAAGAAATDIGQTVQYDGRYRPLPRTYQYSAGFERELPWGVIAQVYFSGSQTVHDSMLVEYDAPPVADILKGQGTSTYLTHRIANPFYGVLPSNTTLGGSAYLPAYDLLRPYPLFNGIAETTLPLARYRYDSMQVFAERRFSQLADGGIFTFLLAYTFSKSYDMSHRLNPWNLSEPPVHEISALDKPQVLAITGLWDLPFGWGRRFFPNIGRVAGAFVNGWAVDWTLTYSSGYPVAMPAADFVCGSYDAPQGQNASHWFNNDPSCWKAPGIYEVRTYLDRFSNIRNPTASQLNVSVEKTFWLSERYTMLLRGESFNLTNTPILPGPNTNFGDPRFGQLPIQQNNFPRYIQVAARFVF
jgi:hypothetical protein